MPSLRGTLPVSVPKLAYYAGVPGMVIAYAGIFSGLGALIGVGVGLLVVLPLTVSLELLVVWRFRRRTAHWPISVDVMPGPDGERIAVFTTESGNVSTLVLPDDYHPEDDNAEWFIRQVAPDLAEAIYGEEEET